MYLTDYNEKMIQLSVEKPTDLTPLIEELSLEKEDTILIKPNWVGAFPGGFTDAKTLDLFLTALQGKRIILLESFTFWRTDKKVQTSEDYFSSREATKETGKQHWDFFKKMDDWFLTSTGIGEVLNKHNAQYINITNEIWQNQIADPNIVKEICETRFKPVENTHLHETIPQKVFELRGKPLISLAKTKIDSSYGASLSIKNMFGLIPDPTRFVEYHGGESENKLTQSIIDINKIYSSLFSVKYINESVFNYCRMDWETEKSDPIPGNGLVVAGNHGSKVDKTTLETLNVKLQGPLLDLLSQYAKQIED